MTRVQELLAAPFSTIAELIAAHARENGSTRAMVQGARTFTYAELDAMMSRVAAGLQRDLEGRRSAVAIVAGTGLTEAIAFLGAMRAGCVPTLIAASATADQVAGMMQDCDAAMVFVDRDTEPLVHGTGVRTVVLDALESWAPREPDGLAIPVIAPEDPFSIVYSSGTTGTPKGIVHTHGLRWDQALAWGGSGFRGATTLVATPLYSNTTLGCALLPTLAYGGTVVLSGKFDARRYLEIAERERVTHTVLVPVQYQRILAVPDFDRFDLSGFRFKICTGAPLPAETKAAIVRRWPGELMELYAMTEGGGACTLYATQHPDKLHTVGQPAAGNEIRLIDEQGREVAPGEIGEVVGRSRIMMTGYHGRPEATGAAEWFDEQGRRFLRHGDLGRFDEDGFLTLLGRSKDMIISGGFNVYPLDIETVLLGHPSVADASVIGVPSDAWGETPYAYYVPEAGSTTSADDLVAWVNARVGKTQRLSGASAVDELPRSGIGKVLKRELRVRFETAAG